MVKKLLIALTLLVSLVSCSHVDTNNSNMRDNEHMAGAYTDERAVTEEDLTVFSSAYKGEVELTPISVSTQVVAGINYKFTCVDKEKNKYRVVIYKRLPSDGGTTEVTYFGKL